MWASRMIDGSWVQGEMIPNDYEALKKDREFSYFLKTLRNQNYWLTLRPLEIAERRFNEISPKLESEIARLTGF
jgi:hypothetical protein